MSLASLPLRSPALVRSWRRSRLLATRCLSTGYEAVIVLGGGVNEAGRPQPWAVQRLNKAVEVQGGRWECPILVSGGGTPHKPSPIDKNGFTVHESTAYAAYLLKQGVPAGTILKESASFDTVGNAYFTTLTHILPRQWRCCAVVTSEFHMPRSRALFSFCSKLASKTFLSGQPIAIDYISSKDEGCMPEDALAARMEKELRSLQKWQEDSSRIHSFPELHEWLFSTHLCYAVSRQDDWSKDAALDPKLTLSY